ncbi:MAG: hypothetical protein RLZZ200_2675 [Pseudomonadota bacterium]
MRVEFAEISLRGAREDNQDRVAIAVAPAAALLVVLDGMGGHANGAEAAETGMVAVLKEFGTPSVPLLDPMGFLHRALVKAHEAVARLGETLPFDRRPRSTLAACLVQEHTAWFGHLGDSRIYHFRDGAVAHRTVDHSHVGLLIREGLINDAQAQVHPMRNYVESCIGGSEVIPEMDIGGCVHLRSGDALLVCSDGFWVPLGDAAISRGITADVPLGDVLTRLAELAVQRAGTSSDNTTAAALRVS